MLRLINPIIKCLIIFAAVLTACSVPEETEQDILWYTQPAENWNEALPLGNGKIGVMVFGNTSNERIQLNDDSLWPADDESWVEPEGTIEDIQKIRQLLFDGKNDLADEMFVAKFSNKGILRSHQTLGDLFINFNHEDITDYRRELNISNATSTISYRSNGNLVTEEVFVSHPAKAIVIEFTSEAPQGLNGKIQLSRPEDKGVPTATSAVTDDKLLVMKGEVTQRGGQFRSESFPITEGVRFETRLQVQNEGGSVKAGEDFLELENVKKATLYLVSNSSYYFDDFSKQNQLDLKALENKSINTLKAEHIADYQKFYTRLDLDLGGNELDSIPTDQRLERIKAGSEDIGLEALLFKFGRYLLISSSREGTNPANLQGLWNEHIQAPWNADYHLNINLQMNYWLADVANLSELNNPLFDYIDRVIESGKTTARKNFGSDGSFFPHATDLWAPTWMRAATAYWGCSMGAAGWMMQHYWQHYEYTRDTAFLKERAFPAIEEVARFYSDWLIEDPRDGTLISAPSTSPENRFINAEGKNVATCLGSAMDQQVIDEVFENYLAACEILQVKNNFVDKIKQQRAQLRPGFVIDDNGRILEWDRPYEESEPGHRHMSHLYGFHPGTSVTIDENPEIFRAVRNTLDFRLENGGAGPGWSRAWLINCSARLMDGEMAHEHVNLLLKRSTGKNLFNLHPPFQIDGNFGFVTGITEMLLQTHENGIVRVLPALPAIWKEGHIKGIKGRGGLTLDIYWSNNKLEKVVIRSDFDRSFKLVDQETTVEVEMKSGETYVYEPEKEMA